MEAIRDGEHVRYHNYEQDGQRCFGICRVVLVRMR
jgi:hypothetical protein